MNAALKDALHCLPAINRRKMYNALRITADYYRSRVRQSPFMHALPFSVSFEPTTSCNLNCPECPSGLKHFTRPTGNMTIPDFEGIFNQIKDTLIWANFYFQGEPFINSSFLQMVEFANKHGVYTSTSTNAHFLRPTVALHTVESGLKRLLVSVDGATQETYESYRKGGSLEKALAGIANVAEARRASHAKNPRIILQFLAVKTNEHEVEEIKKMSKKLGVDEVRIKTAQFYNYRQGNPLMPNNPALSRYKKGSDGLYVIKNRLLNHCWKMWHSTVITWDGKVVPCCFDKDAAHVMGELKHQSFREIWFGEKYNSFRKALLHARSSVDICTNCTEGTRVWA